VHIVPAFAVRPLVLDVIDNEPEVRGNPGGLDRAKIDAEDLGAGKFIGDLSRIVSEASPPGATGWTDHQSPTSPSLFPGR